MIPIVTSSAKTLLMGTKSNAHFSSVFGGRSHAYINNPLKSLWDHHATFHHSDILVWLLFEICQISMCAWAVFKWLLTWLGRWLTGNLTTQRLFDLPLI